MNTKIDYTPLERAGKIYFIGIGGISMSGLAVFALAHGCAVAGSDRGENEQTAALAERGITVYKGHNDKERQHDLFFPGEMDSGIRPARRISRGGRHLYGRGDGKGR